MVSCSHVRQEILHNASVVHYDLRDTIISQTRDIDFVDFPENGVLSLLQPLVHGEPAARTLACDRNHTNEQRCARWLLMTQDRCHSSSFTMTQDFLASMLGCSRTLVNVSAGELQKLNLISFVRGKITVLNRTGLEAICCECYNAMRKYADQLLDADSNTRL